MTIRSGLFNSVNGDRKYLANFFAEYFASFIGNGVFPNPSSGLQVFANGDMTVNIRPGKAWINGYFLINDADYQLTFDVADGMLNRIDRIVLQLNFLNREIVPLVKKGANASNPTAPTLQRDTDAYEIALADIYVGKGILSISQANITDLRLNPSLCGIVHGTVEQIDTTTIYNQYVDWFNLTKESNEIDFDNFLDSKDHYFQTWFDAVRDQLAGDVAASVVAQLNALQMDYDNHLTNEMPHQYTDASTGTTYRWGMGAEEGVPFILIEEVLY